MLREEHRTTVVDAIIWRGFWGHTAAVAAAAVAVRWKDVCYLGLSHARQYGIVTRRGEPAASWEAENAHVRPPAAQSRCGTFVSPLPSRSPDAVRRSSPTVRSPAGTVARRPSATFVGRGTRHSRTKWVPRTRLSLHRSRNHLELHCHRPETLAFERNNRYHLTSFCGFLVCDDSDRHAIRIAMTQYHGC